MAAFAFPLALGAPRHREAVPKAAEGYLVFLGEITGNNTMLHTSLVLNVCEQGVLGPWCAWPWRCFKGCRCHIVNIKKRDATNAHVTTTNGRHDTFCASNFCVLAFFDQLGHGQARGHRQRISTQKVHIVPAQKIYEALIPWKGKKTPSTSSVHFTQWRS